MNLEAFSHLNAVILAGGSGTRLWPLSHQGLPKQFLSVDGTNSLLRLTYERMRGWIPEERIWMVGGEQHAKQATAHLPGVLASHLWIEPEAKNTAPAIALAALQLMARDPQAIMVVLPSDHFIPAAHVEEFRSLLRCAASLASEGSRLVTLGVRPNSPATSYGYIEAGDPLKLGDRVCYRAKSFREKPDAETAQGYFASKRYFWNSGVFVWKAAVFLEKLAVHRPELGKAFAELTAHVTEPNFSARLARTFSKMESISVDYALMESADDVWVVPAEIDWNDVGSLDCFARLLPEDAQGNFSQRELFAIDAHSNLVVAEKPVALIGVHDLAVVETDRALLVVPRERAQEVKELVQWLRKQGRSDLT